MGDELYQFQTGGRLQRFLPAASRQLKAAGYSRKQRALALRNSIANTILDAEIEGTTDLNKVAPATIETVGNVLGPPRGRGANTSSSSSSSRAIPKLTLRESINTPPPPPVRTISLRTRSPSRGTVVSVASTTATVLGARPKSGPPPRVQLQSVVPERVRSRSRSRTPNFGSDFEKEVDYWSARVARSGSPATLRRATEAYNRVTAILENASDSDRQQ